MGQVNVHKNNIWFAGFLLIILAGCVAANSGRQRPTPEWEAPAIALTGIDKVQAGMTYAQVTSIMGDAIHIGYKAGAAKRDVYEEILVRNPYDEEVVESNGVTYKILLYLTHIRKADGIVTEDELTPLVFKEDILVSKERNYLYKLRGR